MHVCGLESHRKVEIENLCENRYVPIVVECGLKPATAGIIKLHVGQVRLGDSKICTLVLLHARPSTAELKMSFNRMGA